MKTIWLHHLWVPGTNTTQRVSWKWNTLILTVNMVIQYSHSLMWSETWSKYFIYLSEQSEDLAMTFDCKSIGSQSTKDTSPAKKSFSSIHFTTHNSNSLFAFALVVWVIWTEPRRKKDTLWSNSETKRSQMDWQVDPVSSVLHRPLSENQILVTDSRSCCTLLNPMQ